MEGTPDILLRIAADRARRVRREGACQGLNLPAARALPLVNFHSLRHKQRPDRLPHPDNEGILIAEVKRKSPSKGDIASIPEPEALAELYAGAGFRRVSVLTEEAHFGGSLADLLAVKSAHPHLAVLRKDFLLTEEDVEVSCRGGADAILLIAALLDAQTLCRMYHRAEKLRLSCLVEVHTQADVDKVRPLRPPLVGINSRDLRRFFVDPLLPLETRAFIDWPCDVIYESGISRAEDALFVRGTGFSGFLVGEAVARTPPLASKLIRAWTQEGEARRCYQAWAGLYARYKPQVPLVKICGLTSRKDAKAAVDGGADLLGFVLADSPRQVTLDFIRTCADLPVSKAAVVVLRANQDLPADIADLLDQDILDFIQFHGDESPSTVRAWPSYKALNLKTPGDAAGIGDAGSPAVLVDAFSPEVRGGSGKLLDAEIVTAAAERRRLWLAGGLTPDNVGDIVKRFHPALVDVSTGVAVNDGVKRRKDHKKMHRFMAVVKDVGHE